MSARRACRVVAAARKSMRYRLRRGDDAEVREQLRELAQQRRRFGYKYRLSNYRLTKPHSPT